MENTRNEVETAMFVCVFLVWLMKLCRVFGEKPEKIDDWIVYEG